MLVITRKVGESFVIGDNINVTICRIRGDSTRIGIEAPPHVPVLRAEIPKQGPRQDSGERSPDGV